MMAKQIYVDSSSEEGPFEVTDEHYRDVLPDGTDWTAIQFDSGAYPVCKTYRDGDVYHPHYEILLERGRVKTAQWITEYYDNPELGSSIYGAGWVEYEDGRIVFYNSTDYSLAATRLPKQAYSQFQEMSLFDTNTKDI
jgi:hypothetical protein